eukprot:TRINITY_DN10990_c0_g2_i1.p1 TRINITY_DN10990_c0_g2~~TRINITY_DN10990_c0_g2_i1.p1  ORF type:complete len:418 (+),score=54.19 TRINITY_DN10990_c0_g2_i1:86-1339(+)
MLFAPAEVSEPSQTAVIEDFESDSPRRHEPHSRHKKDTHSISIRSDPSVSRKYADNKERCFSIVQWGSKKPPKKATLPPLANMAEVLLCQRKQHLAGIRYTQLTVLCILILILEIIVHSSVGDYNEILAGVTICTIIQTYFVISHHTQSLAKEQLKDPLTVSKTIFCSDLFLEIAANFLHCPPFIVGMWKEARLFNIFVLFRLIGALRLVRDHFFIDCHGGLLAGNLTRERLTLLFLTKTLLFRCPMRTIFILVIIVFVVNTVLLRVTENSSFWDTFWLQFVTMTTVGFGDITPQKTLGIILACLASIQGILISSISVALLTKGLDLCTRDKVMINFLNSFVVELQKRNISKDIVVKCCKIVTIHRSLEKSLAAKKYSSSTGCFGLLSAESKLDSQLKNLRIELDGLLRKKKVCNVP